MTYEGWKNYETWNVSLWLNNEYAIYQGAVEFMKDYKGKDPYKDFCIESGLSAQRTADRVEWLGAELDYEELNSMMKELVEEDLVACDRCSGKVGEETLITIGSWKVCENCWDDL